MLIIAILLKPLLVPEVRMKLIWGKNIDPRFLKNILFLGCIVVVLFFIFCGGGLFVDNLNYNLQIEHWHTEML